MPFHFRGLKRPFASFQIRELENSELVNSWFRFFDITNSLKEGQGIRNILWKNSRLKIRKNMWWAHSWTKGIWLIDIEQTLTDGEIFSLLGLFWGHRSHFKAWTLFWGHWKTKTGKFIFSWLEIENHLKSQLRIFWGHRSHFLLFEIEKK